MNIYEPIYILCIFIYGHIFSLGWYDHQRVIISDDCDILDNLNIIVNVILQLMTHISSDTTGHSYYQFEYPSFLVSMGATGDMRLWKTEGSPIWSSLPLLQGGHMLVSWSAPSVLSYNEGAGVPHDLDLHCLVLKTVGHPLWDAGTTKDFILGSLTALKGHQGLVEQGILHQDMSPGNIFLGSPDDAESWEGFVADLELASVVQPETETIFSLHPLSPSVEITGTALFMTKELLSMMLLPDKSKKEI
ncbi:hypothetical protein F4604DRAFT_1689594 [Suillus subluteus]|nr:hypothetical protein F4604DRAFT_1689594 [Suillus subluteus]